MWGMVYWETSCADWETSCVETWHLKHHCAKATWERWGYWCFPCRPGGHWYEHKQVGKSFEWTQGYLCLVPSWDICEPECPPLWTYGPGTNGPIQPVSRRFQGKAKKGDFLQCKKKTGLSQLRDPLYIGFGWIEPLVSIPLFSLPWSTRLFLSPGNHVCAAPAVCNAFIFSHF